MPITARNGLTGFSAIVTTLLVLFYANASSSEDIQSQPEIEKALTGKDIAQRVYDRDDGEDFYSFGSMVLIDKRGKERRREMITHRKDFGELSKTLIRFTKPADIEGTGFLSWENEDRDDDQFIFLPELRRVRRVASRKKDGQFVNSDYTYEDMERRKVEKDDHCLLGEEDVNGWRCYVLESVPKKGSGSQYSKLKMYVIKDLYLAAKVEYYGKKLKLTKIFTAREIEKIDGIWTMLESEMVNLKREHRTILASHEVRYNRGISDDVFTKRYLENY
jgi:hypothetical protein